MQAFIRHEEERHALPVIEITFKQVRRELDKIDKRIPDLVCREIVKSENPKRRLEQVIFAAQAIAAMGNENAFELFQEDEKIALRFAQNPLMFQRLVSATGADSFYAFEALRDDYIGREFDKNPEMITNALRDIGWAAGGGAGDAFGALYNDEDIVTAKLFSKNPLAFVEIAKATKNRAGYAFGEIGSYENAALFSEYPSVFVEVAQATGASAGITFGSMTKDGDFNWEEIEFDKALGEHGVKVHYDLLMGVISDDRRINAEFSYLDERMEIKEFIKSAGKDAPLAMYCLLWFGVENEEGESDQTTGTQGIRRAMDEIIRKGDDEFFENALNRAKERFEVFKTLGISFPERYDGRILENVYQTVTGDADYSKKLAFVILNKNDYNGAFANDQPIYNSLLDHGYNLIICETDNESELLARFFEHGKTDGEKVASAIKDKKYDLVIIAGHGTAQTLKLGANVGEENFLDVWDDELFTRDWKGKFAENARIVLMSCSTGGTVENSGNFQFSMNLMTYLGDKTGVRVFAPKVDASEKALVFGKSDAVDGVEYNRDSKKNILNSYENNQREK